jgi:protein-tyrosine phosphatase
MLRRQGITAILCLTEPAEKSVPHEIEHGFVWQRVPIPDGFTGGKPSEAQFTQALDILHRWFTKSHVVYVHCLAGVGRSASVCSLYVAQSQGMDLGAAISLVKQQHQYANPDPHQIEVMHRFLASMAAS